jgi:hypothetical protein
MGEWGMGNGEWGMRNAEWGMGNAKFRMGNVGGQADPTARIFEQGPTTFGHPDPAP